jgi:hypothetical protein
MNDTRNGDKFMSYLVEKHYIERFEIEKIKTDFMKYKRFSAVRKDIPNCKICSKEFEPDDNTNLAFIKGKKNHLICDDCATEAIQAGVEIINW